MKTKSLEKTEKVTRIYTLRLTQKQIARIVEGLIQAGNIKLAELVLKQASKKGIQLR